MATKKTQKKTTSAAKKTNAPATTTLTVVPDRIDGVDTTKVKPELVRAALDEVGLASKGPVTELIPSLMNYYRGQYSEDEWFKCDACGGLSVEEDDACPFCGDTEIDEGVEEVVGAEADDRPVVETKPKIVKTNINKKKSAPDLSKGAAATKERAETKPTIPKPKTSKALIVAPLDEETKLAREKFTKKDLAKKESLVNKYRQGFAENAWNLGNAIADIHDSDSWRVADDAKGKPFKNFRVYAQEVLGITARWAYDLMMISKSSDMKTAKQLGTTKLRAILQAPEDIRDDLIEDAKKGLSREALQKKIKDAKKAAASASGTTVDPVPPEKRPFTCVVKPGLKSVPMYKSKDRKKGDDDVRAVRIDDEPELTFELENGTLLTVRVTKGKDGKLQGKVRFEKI